MHAMFDVIDRYPFAWALDRKQAFRSRHDRKAEESSALAFDALSAFDRAGTARVAGITGIDLKAEIFSVPSRKAEIFSDFRGKGILLWINCVMHDLCSRVRLQGFGFRV